MSHTTKAFSKATFPLVVPVAYLYYFTTKEAVEKKEEQTQRTSGLASCMQTASKTHNNYFNIIIVSFIWEG